MDAIHTTPDADQFFIDPDLCTDCGACVVVCPVDAIFADSDVPERWRNFIELNAAASRAKAEKGG